MRWVTPAAHAMSSIVSTSPLSSLRRQDHDRAFNNADTAPRGGPVSEMNEADWDLITAFDFKGVDCG